MSKLTQCATDDMLRSYVCDQMERELEPAIDLHLQSCDRCQSRMEQLTGTDAWWREAEAMLVDFTPSGEVAENNSMQSSASAMRLPGITSHLANWMGPTDDPAKIGRIGPYEIIGVIGYGGAGVVLRGHDNRLNRPVAIKALLPALTHNPMARRRFERESRAVAAITHQNVVPIYAVDTYNDHPYIAMYYVGGWSLQQRISQTGPLQVSEIVRISSQIAQALEAAHAQGVIHRDIKPANILLESNVDRVYVSDFGLARVADDATTHSGMVTGTPQYMSPEQCHGAAIDHRTDLFSLGSVMYTMCTGRAPFRSDTLFGVLRKVSDVKPRRIREINSDIPPWLESFVDRLLRKRPDERFATAGQVAKLLDGELAYLNSPTTVPIPERQWLPEQDPVSEVSEDQKTDATSAATQLSASTDSADRAVSHVVAEHSKPPLTQRVQNLDPKTFVPVSLLKRKLLMTASILTLAAACVVAFLQSGDTNSGAKLQKKSASEKQGAKLNSHDDKSKKASPPTTSRGATSNEVAVVGRPGELVTILGDYPGGVVDGYTIYLPRTYDEKKVSFPVMVYLQGGLGVGGEVSKVNGWGVPRLLQRDDLDDELGSLLKDQFIVVSPHIQSGQFYEHADAMEKLVGEVLDKYNADGRRVYLTGLSRGGSGTWGLASRMPGTFAAIAPIAGSIRGIDEYKPLLDTSIFISHNIGDGTFDYNDTNKIVRKLEEIGEVEFHRISTPVPTNDEYLDQRRVIISVDVDSHDAWSEVYNDTSIYKWMLTHRLRSAKKSQGED